jgi:hypothetical protein
MAFLFHGCEKKPRFGRWWLGLLIVSALGLSGCKHWGARENTLRESDLAGPARQIRSKSEFTKDQNASESDDWLMSDKAKKISRNLQ